MALNPVVLTEGGSSGADDDEFTTASISPAANKPTHLFVYNNRLAGGTIPTINPAGTGAYGSDWDLVDTIEHTSIGRRISMFRAGKAVPGTGTVTIGFGGLLQGSCDWSIVQWDGADTSGTNGSGSILQAVADQGNGGNMSIALGAFDDPVNNAALAFIYHQADEVTSPCTSPDPVFTELADRHHSSPPSAVQTSWLLGDSDPCATWATSGVDFLAIAVEVKSSSTPPPPPGGGTGEALCTPISSYPGGFYPGSVVPAGQTLFPTGDPPPPVCCPVEPPVRGTLGAIFTFESVDGMGPVFMEAYRDCPGSAGEETAVKQMALSLIPPSSTIVVDCAQHTVTVTTVDQDTGAPIVSDGKHLLELPTGRALEWIEAHDCDDIGCFCARPFDSCSGGTDTTVQISTQQREG